jgi:cytochrome P450
MIINVNDLNLPIIDSKFIPSSRNTYEQLEQARQVSNDTWIAKTVFGYAILNHNDIEQILKDKRWHNALTLLAKRNPYTTEDFKKRRMQAIICLEGEDHSRIKRLVQPAFSPSNINNLRPYMREYMNSLIDNVYANGKCDIQKEIYDKYPVNMICKILGVPDTDWILFNKWTTDTFKNFGMNYDEDTEIVIETQKAFEEYSSKIIEEKRLNLGDDLLSNLIRAEESGDRLSNSELKMLVEMIIVSGIDTTRSQLGLSTIMLSKNKDLWTRIAVDDDARNKIVEESIRLDGALRNVARYASEDIVYKGVLFPKETSILLSISAANYNPTIFENPDNFIYDRPNLIKETLGFGGGIHYCLGTALARAELQEGLSTVATRMPDLAVQDGVVYKETVETVWGVRSLPVKF